MAGRLVGIVVWGCDMCSLSSQLAVFGCGGVKRTENNAVALFHMLNRAHNNLLTKVQYLWICI